MPLSWVRFEMLYLKIFFAMDVMTRLFLAIYFVLLHSPIPADSVPISDSYIENQVGDDGVFNEISNKKIPDRFAESFNLLGASIIRRTEGGPSGVRGDGVEFGRRNRRYGGRERLIRDGSRNFFRREGEGLDARLLGDYPVERPRFDSLLDAPEKAYTEERVGYRKKDHLWNGPVVPEAGKTSSGYGRSFLGADANDLLIGPSDVFTAEEATETSDEYGTSSHNSSTDPGKSVESSSIGIASEPLLMDVSGETVTWEAGYDGIMTDHPKNGNVTSDETSGYGTAVPSSLPDDGVTVTGSDGSVNHQEGPADVVAAMAMMKTSIKSKTSLTDDFPAEDSSTEKTIENPSHETDYKLLSAHRGLEGFKASHKGPSWFRKTLKPTGREDGERNSRLRGKMRTLMTRYLSFKNRFREDHDPYRNFDQPKKEKSENPSKRKHPSMTGKDLSKQAAVNINEPVKEINADLKLAQITGPIKHQKSSPKNISDSNTLMNPFKEHAFEHTTQGEISDVDPSSKSKREFITEKRCKENAFWYIYIIAGLGSLNVILSAVLGVFLFKIFRRPQKARYAKLVSDFSIGPDNSENSKETCSNPVNYLNQSPSVAVQKTASKQPSLEKSKIPILKNETKNPLVQNSYQRIRCIEMPSLETIPEVDETNISSDHELRANSNFSLLSYKMEITRETNKATGKEPITPGTKHKNISYELKKISYNPPPKVSAKRSSKREFDETSLTKSPSRDKVQKHHENGAKINQATTNDRKADSKSKNRQKNKTKPRKVPGKTANPHGYSVVTETDPQPEIRQTKFGKKESGKRHIKDQLEKTSINTKNKDGTVLKGAKNDIHPQKDYPKMLNPFETDHSGETNSEYDSSEVSNMEYSDDSFSDVSDQNADLFSSLIETNKKVEHAAATKTLERDLNNDDVRNATTHPKFSNDVPASKRLMKLHRKFASKGFCGPTGSLN